MEKGQVLLVGLDAQRSAAPVSDRHALFERAQAAVSTVPGVAGLRSPW